MNDMSSVIIPKSDQISADDLLAGPITIQITSVTVRPGTEQPVTISYVGDNGRPWKPCKSMARVLVAGWGAQSSGYAGKSATLYRDPDVKWGGLAVGGIRISHMSDIPRDMVMALTQTKGSKKAFTVKPLAVKVEQPAAPAVAQPVLLHPETAEPTPCASFEQWQKRCMSAITRFSDPLALRKWAQDMEAHFAPLPADVVLPVRQALTARVDALAEADAERGEDAA